MMIGDNEGMYGRDWLEDLEWNIWRMKDDIYVFCFGWAMKLALHLNKKKSVFFRSVWKLTGLYLLGYF